MGNDGILARINELKTSISQGVVNLEIRNRSFRLQILQNQLDGLLALQRARALLYAYHPEGATGMVMKDYRGQKAQKEIWKFDAGLVAQITATLKQAAIEVGQWGEKRETVPVEMPPANIEIVFVTATPRIAETAAIDVRHSPVR